MRFSVLAAAVLGCAVCAHADTVATYNLTVTSFPGETITGPLTLDTTTGKFTQASLKASGFVGINGSGYTDIASQGPASGFPLAGDLQVEITDSGSGTGSLGEVLLTLSASSLVNFSGSDIPLNAVQIRGSPVPTPALSYSLVLAPSSSVTPEPSSLLLLGTGLLGTVGVVRRRMAS